MPCSADVHFLEMKRDTEGGYWPTVALFCGSFFRCGSFISAWHSVMFTVPCPPLTAHLTISRYSCFPDLLWVKPCCIICVLKKDINPSSHCTKWLFFYPPRLNVHWLKNDTSSKYFWAKAELYNFPISSEHLSVERRNYMAGNGFLNSDITS